MSHRVLPYKKHFHYYFKFNDNFLIQTGTSSLIVLSSLSLFLFLFYFVTHTFFPPMRPKIQGMDSSTEIGWISMNTSTILIFSFDSLSILIFWSSILYLMNKLSQDSVRMSTNIWEIQHSRLTFFSWSSSRF